MDIRSPVLASDIALRALCGCIDDRGDHLVVRTPENPGYYEGNFVVLAQAPTLGNLSAWLETARAAFADDPRIDHATLLWDGGPISDDVAAVARASGGAASAGLDMQVRRVQPHPRAAEVQMLTVHDFDAIEALNRAGDASEAEAAAEYRRFKQAIRDEWKRWMEAGHARWYGAFRDQQLIGQCGLIRQGDVARFQAVETHPDHQRTGVATTLIGTVANLALDEGATRVFLVADPTGPALGLYRRLGFEALGVREAWVWGGEKLRARPELPADHADVRALTAAAFESEQEADLIDSLRDQPGVVSLVAVRSGQVLGHVLFSPATIGDAAVMALGPMAVKPGHQRQGIGSLLVREGLNAIRAARACVVLGHPEFYPRFGFQPARPLGIDCQWPVPDRVFMARGLAAPGLDGLRGMTHYHPAFGQLD